MALAALVAAALAGCGGKGSDAQLQSAARRLEQGDTAGAIVDSRAALAGNERSARGRLLLGRALLAAGDLAGAEAELTRAGEFGAALDQLAPLQVELLVAQGRSSSAVERFGRLQPATPEAAARLALQLARAHVAMGESDKAQEVLAAAQRDAPDDVPIRLLQARLLAASGPPSLGLQIVDTVLAKQPGNATALVTRADLLTLPGGDAAAAAAAYRKAIEASPRLEAAHAGLIALLLRQDDREGVKQQVDAIAKALPNSPSTRYYQAVQAYLARDYVRARDLTQSLAHGAGDQLRVTYLLALAEARLGNFGQAEAQFSRAVQIMPDAHEPRRELGALLVHAGQPERALEVLAPLMRSDAADAATWTVVGRAQMRRGDFRAADEAFARAARLRPSDPKIRAEIGRSLVARGQADAGLRELEAAAEADRGGSDADLALIAVQMARGNAAGALEAVDALARKQPASPLPAHVRGRILQARGDPAAARKAYEEAVTKDARFLPAVSSLADLDLAEKQPAAARRRYEALLKADPRNAAALMAIAVITRREGAARDKAAAWIDKAVAAQPQDVSVWVQAIDFHRRDGDAAAALARAQAANAALRNEPQLLAELAAAQLATGNRQQAVSTLARLVQLAPQSADAHLRLAQAQLDAGDRAAARTHVERALQLAPEWPAALRASVALSLLSDDSARARALAQQVQKRQASSPLGWLLQGEIDERLGDATAAAASFRAAFAKRAEGETAIALDRALRAVGAAGEAGAHEQRWLEAHPEDTGFIVQLAQRAERDGDLPAAEARYRDALRERPDDALLLNNLAYVQARAGRPEALATARRALAIAPYRPELQDTLAFVHAQRREFDRAVEAQTKAVELAPDNGTLRLALARYLASAGRKDKARDELRRLTNAGRRGPEQEAAAGLLHQLGN